jgi:hypothetical protein
MAVGIAGTLSFVFHHGETMGARILGIGVTLANAGNPDFKWTVEIDHRTKPLTQEAEAAKTMPVAAKRTLTPEATRKGK